jgi:uncharacterized membrane protein
MATKAATKDTTPKDTFKGISTEPPKEQAGLNEDSKLFSALGYVLGILIAIIIFLLKKDDKYTRRHCAQAILFDISLVVVYFLVAVCIIIGTLVFGIATAGIGIVIGFMAFYAAMIGLGLLVFLLKLYFAYKAFKGQMFSLPIIGNYAAKMAG